MFVCVEKLHAVVYTVKKHIETAKMLTDHGAKNNTVWEFFGFCVSWLYAYIGEWFLKSIRVRGREKFLKVGESW